MAGVTVTHKLTSKVTSARKGLAPKLSERPRLANEWLTDLRCVGGEVGLRDVEADDPKELEKAAMIIRAYGNSTTETMMTRPWKEFLEML